MSLFKKMDPKADVGTPTSLKSSVQRGIRTKLLEQYGETLGANDGAMLEQIWPKKEPMTTVKFKREHVQILLVKGVPLFFQHYDGPYLPTLHVLHQCMLLVLTQTPRSYPGSRWTVARSSFCCRAPTSCRPV